MPTHEEEAADLIRQALFYRARAKRVRELATAVSHSEATAALRQYAAEIEQQAVELEAKAAALRQGYLEDCD